MSTNEIKEPEIGDTIYSESPYHGLDICSIKRMTNTLIILLNPHGSEIKIRKPFVNGCSEIGISGYGRQQYYLQDLTIQQEYNHQLSRAKFQSIFNKTDLKKVPIENLNKMIELLSDNLK